MSLPSFRYHPDPVETGAIVLTQGPCNCCGQARGYKYNSVFYAREEVDSICPWCIFDGSAARKFDGVFLDGHPLKKAGLAQSVLDEVCQRTPGYNSWQQQIWQAHCDDACEFHGDASVDEIQNLDGEALQEFLTREGIKPQRWPEIRDGYTPGGDTSIFKFVCRKCRCPVFNLDLS